MYGNDLRPRHFTFLLGPNGSLMLALAMAMSFVGALYVWSLCGLKVRDRNLPDVIKQRIISVIVVCVVAPIAVAYFCQVKTRRNQSTQNILSVVEVLEFWNFLGLRTYRILEACVAGVVLNVVLFAGPILEDPNFMSILTSPDLSTLMKIRNFFIGPVCEEWLYRAVLCGVLALGGWNVNYVAMASPILFGLSHCHHLYQQVRFERKASFKMAVFTVGFQLCYTTVFGAWAGFVFVRTGHILPCILMHFLCNMLGFPRFGFRRFRNLRDYFVGSMYVGGVIGFFYFFPLLTEPKIYKSPYFTT